MEYTDFVGIDVSQGTLDVVVRKARIHEQIANTVVGTNKLLKWLERQGVAWEGALFCFENTGIYSLPLLAFLADRKVKYAQISGLAAKRSMGIKRGKTDKVDAAALAEYAYRHREELIPNPPPSKVLLKAKRFFSLREQFVKHRAGLKSRLGAELRMLQLPKNDKGVRMQQKAIDQLTKHIDQLDAEILELVPLRKPHYTRTTNWPPRSRGSAHRRLSTCSSPRRTSPSSKTGASMRAMLASCPSITDQGRA